EDEGEPHQPAGGDASELGTEEADHAGTATASPVRAKNASSRLVSTARSSLGKWPSATRTRVTASACRGGTSTRIRSPSDAAPRPARWRLSSPPATSVTLTHTALGRADASTSSIVPAATV